MLATDPARGAIINWNSIATTPHSAVATGSRKYIGMNDEQEATGDPVELAERYMKPTGRELPSMMIERMVYATKM